MFATVDSKQRRRKIKIKISIKSDVRLHLDRSINVEAICSEAKKKKKYVGKERNAWEYLDKFDLLFCECFALTALPPHWDGKFMSSFGNHQTLFCSLNRPYAIVMLRLKTFFLYANFYFEYCFMQIMNLCSDARDTLFFLIGWIMRVWKNFYGNYDTNLCA